MEAEAIDLLVQEEVGVTGGFDAVPSHHLPDDDLDVLVVDVNALQAVDLLNGIDQVALGELLAQHRQ